MIDHDYENLPDFDLRLFDFRFTIIWSTHFEVLIIAVVASLKKMKFPVSMTGITDRYTECTSAYAAYTACSTERIGVRSELASWIHNDTTANREGTEHI